MKHRKALKRGNLPVKHHKALKERLSLSALALHLIICLLITIIWELSPEASGFGFISFLFLYLFSIPIVNIILSIAYFISDIIEVKAKRLNRIGNTSIACLLLSIGVLFALFCGFGDRYFDFMKNKPDLISDLLYLIGIPCTVAMWVLWIIDFKKRKNDIRNNP